MCEHECPTSRLAGESYRITGRECMHLVTRGHFPSHDKNDDHTIWFTILENPMLPAKFMALCYKELELSPIEVIHCGNRNIFYLLAPVTLTLTRCAKMNFLHPHFRKLSSDRQTWQKLHTTTLCAWSKMNRHPAFACHWVIWSIDDINEIECLAIKMHK